MTTTGGTPSRQRRRGPALEAALLDAAWADLAEAGYAKLTMESVASRAGTGIAVLYRRWANKDELVLAALEHYRNSHPVDLPDTGTMIFTSDAVYMGDSYGPPAVPAAIVNNLEQWYGSVEKLRRIGEELQRYPGVVRVDGHTDNVPIGRSNVRFPTNQALSEARATNAAAIIIERLGDRSRVVTRGYADTRPVADNGTAEGRARNRRVEIFLGERGVASR